MTSPQDPWQQDPRSPGGQQPPGQYPPGQQPPGQYPQYPGQPPQGGYSPVNPYAAPPVPPHEAGGVPRPRTIEVAFWIAVVVPLVATVLIAISAWFAQGVMQQVIEAEGPEAQQLANAAALVGVGVVIFVFAVLTALWILFAFKMRAGRNWARITLTVFAGLWVMNALSGLLTSPSGSSFSMAGMPAATVEIPAAMVALGYTQSALGLVSMVAFLVLVYLRPSNRFFQAARYR
ncbi:hypothetical protein [Halopolyspora algeriensis]|uniref:hypothetical protein n=1 Tax=Halopolyspora algeriensis TaxID=1500506 RepID=UPI00114E5BD2|nr:hypothetical protein [Halopolyspora algeriensis]